MCCCKQFNTYKRTKEPKNATIQIGYDLLTAEENILFPRFVTPITIKLKMGIPCGYFRKVYPRSNLLKNYFVSCDAGVINLDFRGTVLILMTNNSKDPILIKAGQRIAQIVFYKKKKLCLKQLIASVQQKEELKVLVQRGFNFLQVFFSV